MDDWFEAALHSARARTAKGYAAPANGVAGGQTSVTWVRPSKQDGRMANSSAGGVLGVLVTDLDLGVW